MQILKIWINKVLECFSIELNIFGYEFTFLDVFILSALISMLAWFLSKIFN